MILKKNIFLKSTIFKKLCTQKITFCLISPRKMRRFCVLRAYLKSMILKKKVFFKKHDFEEKNIFKKHDFDKKFFVESMVLN